MAVSGLRLATAAEYVKRGWRVVPTARGSGADRLAELQASSSGRLTVEELDINIPEQVTALRSRRAAGSFGLLLANAAITNGDVPQPKSRPTLY